MATNGGSIRLGFELDTKQLQAQLSKAYKDLEKLTNDNAKLSKEKVKLQMDIAPFEQDYTKYVEMLNNIKQMQQEYNNLKLSGGAGSSYQEIYDLGEKIANAKQSADEYNQKLKGAFPEYQKQATKLQEINKALEQNNITQEQTNKKIEDTTSKLQKAKDMASFREGVGNLQGGINKISRTITGIIKKMSMWLLAIFSIRSAYSMIKNSISTIQGYNDQLKADIAYMKFALGSTLQPVVETIVNLAYKLLAVIGAIVKTLTGYNIFGNATIENFKKTQGAIKDTNSSAKDLKKTLAGFDEMNVLNDSSSGSGSGSGSGFTMPSIDLSTTDLFKNWNLETALTELANKINTFFETTDFGAISKAIGDDIAYFFNTISDFLDTIKWEQVGASIETALHELPWLNIIVSLIRFVWSLIKANWRMENGILRKLGEDLRKDLEKAIKESPEFKNALLDIGGWIITTIITGGMLGLWAHVLTFGKNILGGILKALGFEVDDNGNTNGKNKKTEKAGQDMGTSIIDGLLFGLQLYVGKVLWPFTRMWELICGFFGIHSPSTKFEGMGKDMIQGLINGIKGMIGRLQTLFSNIGATVANAVGNTFKAVINGIISLIESRINSTINTINGVLGFIKKLPIISGFTGKISNLSKVSFPRLAKGGIINMPNKGVMVGSAVAGESGREGVLPLTDSQAMEQLGEAIGRYITINANITNTMNGRIISRELQKINNENDFAFNR